MAKHLSNILFSLIIRRNHLHAEGETDARDLSSDIAEPDDPKAFAS
jgi:hypothetical protein